MNIVMRGEWQYDPINHNVLLDWECGKVFSIGIFITHTTQYRLSLPLRSISPLLPSVPMCALTSCTIFVFLTPVTFQQKESNSDLAETFLSTRMPRVKNKTGCPHTLAAWEAVVIFDGNVNFDYYEVSEHSAFHRSYNLIYFFYCTDS